MSTSPQIHVWAPPDIMPDDGGWCDEPRAKDYAVVFHLRPVRVEEGEDDFYCSTCGATTLGEPQ